jgi:hypothetical protein
MWLRFLGYPEWKKLDALVPQTGVVSATPRNHLDLLGDDFGLFQGLQSE